MNQLLTQAVSMQERSVCAFNYSGGEQNLINIVAIYLCEHSYVWAYLYWLLVGVVYLTIRKLKVKLGIIVLFLVLAYIVKVAALNLYFFGGIGQWL